MRPAGDVVCALACGATVAASHSPWELPLTSVLIISALVVLGALGTKAAALLWLIPVVCVPTLSARSLSGLVPPAVGRYSDQLVLVDDPVMIPGGQRVTVRWRGKRLTASARGPSSSVLRPLSAGARVNARFDVKPWATEPPGWAISRHLAGRVNILELRRVDAGSLPWRWAGWVRSIMEDGTQSMTATSRSLFAGFVVGDGRNQPVAVADDFRASGLSHLLVVSGQNVAFALAAVGPLLKRLGPRPRFVCALCILAAFGTLTRWEPSVLRAEAMVACALWATVVGRPQPRLRILCVAVTALVLVDPLLTRSLGFGLSVAATVGLAVLAQPIADRLPGPIWLRIPLATTLAAQLGTAPLLATLPGGVSAIAVPANLLALPAAEPVTIWGLLVGVPAGLLGGPIAAVLHLPSRILIGWVAMVARNGAKVGPGAGGTAVALAVCVAIVLLRSQPVGAAAVVVAVAAFGLVRIPALDGVALAGGATVWRAGALLRPAATVVVVDQVKGPALLRSLRASRIGAVEVLVVAQPSNATWTALIPVLARHEVGTVVTLGPIGALEGGPALVGLVRGDRVIIDRGGGSTLEVTCDPSRPRACTIITSG